MKDKVKRHAAVSLRHVRIKGRIQ